MARIAMVHDVAGVAAVQTKILRAAGHDVDQIELPEIGATWRWPAKAFSLPVRLVAYAPAIRKIRGGRYDVVHIHWLANGIAGLLSRREFFAQAHGSDLHVNLNNPIYRPVTRAVLDRARAVFYVTPNLRRYMPGVDSKLRYLPNPVDPDIVAPDPMVPTRVARVFIFARIDPVKGVDHIFQVVEQLSGLAEVSAPDWGPLAAEYEHRYSRWVKFVPTVPHSEIGALLQKFDVVVGQMKQGILSLSEIEAMAAARPVITGIDLSLYPDDPPPVIAVSEPREIVEAVARLQTDPEELSRLSREGREWVRRNHSYDRHLRILEQAYFGESNGRSTAM
jgi:glycosyltransferase involved in cell wall biosynthesis